MRTLATGARLRWRSVPLRLIASTSPVWRLLSGVGQEFAGVHLQCLGQGEKVEECDVAKTSLKGADVAHVQFCALGESFLTQAKFEPPLSDSTTELCEARVRCSALSHAGRLRDLRPWV